MVAQFEMPMLKGSVSEGAGPKHVSLLYCCSANTICTDQAQLISLYGSESALAQLFWLEVSPTQLQLEGHTGEAFR